ncbi:MAG: hypothetical protein RLY43_1413 [Bacteroidota bacterium]
METLKLKNGVYMSKSDITLLQKQYREKEIQMDGNVILRPNASYFIDRRTCIGETVYLMPFVREHLMSNKSLPVSKKIKKPHIVPWLRKITLTPKSWAVTVLGICEKKNKVLVQFEDGTKIYVPQSYFSKRFSK